MVDDSNLDYIVTFLGKCHTTATVKSFTAVRNVNASAYNDTERMLVYPPELISVDNNHYVERYMVKLSEVDEAGILGMRNDIIDNIIKLNTRQTIAAYTRETTLLYAEIMHSNKAFEHGTTKRWEQDLFIDFTFSTS